MSCRRRDLFPRLRQISHRGLAPLAAARRLVSLFAIVVSTAGSLWAHGELDLQIAELTRRIRQSPGDATLYLHRGELHRLHGDPAAALVDVAEARRLNPGSSEADFVEGRALMDLERWSEARSALDRFLTARPDQPIALWHRAQTLVKLDQRRLAEADFKRCFEVAPNPTPELVLARATNLARAGELEPSLIAIEEGLQQLGGIVSMELAAVDLEVRLNRRDAALARLDRLIASSARKEALLLRKGNLLAQTGQADAARECYAAAQTEWESLPPTTRKTRSNRALGEEIDKALAKLPVAPAPAREETR